MAGAGAPLISRSAANKVMVQKSSTAEHAARTKVSVRAHGTKTRQKVRASKQIAMDKAAIRAEAEQQNMLARRSAQKKQARHDTITGAAKAPFEPRDTISINKSNPVINPILLILFTWAGIVIMYAFITQPSASTGFMLTLKQWVGMIYTAKPMFALNAPTGDTKS
jgi:hypothetical protein